MKRPRLWETAENVGANKQEIAFHLGMAVSTFDELRPKLEAEGMPKPDPVTETWCVPAVDRWWLARHNVDAEGAAAPQPANTDTGLGGRIKEWQPKKSA